MEELSIQGREMTSQLKGVPRSVDVRLAEGLVILNAKQEDNVQADSSDRSVGSAIAGGDSSSSDAAPVDDAVRSDDPKEDRSTKGTRGGFINKRRKSLHSWIKDTLDLVNDGHAWRKYGQKFIHNSKHPRSYFRCTHKFEQGCNATKHVQKMKDEPQLFRTTYYANHTCNDYLRAQEFVLDCSSSREDSSQNNIIRFDNVDLKHPFFETFTSIKEEEMVKPISDRSQPTSSSSASLVSHEQGVFEPFYGFSSTLAYDHEDLISSMMNEYLLKEANLRYG